MQDEVLRTSMENQESRTVRIIYFPSFFVVNLVANGRRISKMHYLIQRVKFGQQLLERETMKQFGKVYQDSGKIDHDQLILSVFDYRECELKQIKLLSLSCEYTQIVVSSIALSFTVLSNIFNFVNLCNRFHFCIA